MQCVLDGYWSLDLDKKRTKKIRREYTDKKAKFQFIRQVGQPYAWTWNYIYIYISLCIEGIQSHHGLISNLILISPKICKCMNCKVRSAKCDMHDTMRFNERVMSVKLNIVSKSAHHIKRTEFSFDMLARISIPLRVRVNNMQMLLIRPHIILS